MQYTSLNICILHKIKSSVYSALGSLESNSADKNNFFSLFVLQYLILTETTNEGLYHIDFDTF